MKKEIKSEKKENVSKFNNSFFKIAGYCGLALVIFFILGLIVSKLLSSNLAAASFWSIVQGIVINLLTIIFTMGFYFLGKKYNKTFLKVMSILLIIFIVISAIVTLFVISPLVVNLENIAIQKAIDLNLDITNLNESDSSLFLQTLFSDQQFLGIFGIIAGLFLIYVVVCAILFILFGISLIKLKEKVRYAKTAGVLSIVGGATLIVFIGVFPLLASFIYQLIILFRENKN